MKNNNLSESAKAIKKRITRNAFVIGILVFVFITVLTFTMSVKQASTAFQNKFNQTMWAIRSWDTSSSTFDEMTQSFGMMMGYYDEGEYPVALGFYSLDGELKYTSGSVIDLNADGKFITISIDKYMTEDVVREVEKFLDHKNKNELRLSNCKYYLDKEEIIPTELTFEILKEREPILTDEGYNYEHLVVWSKTIKFSDKTPTKSGDVYGFYFVDKTFSGKNGKVAKSLFEFLEKNTEPGVIIDGRLRFYYVPEGESIWGSDPTSVAKNMEPIAAHTDEDRAYLVTNPVDLNGETGYYIVAAGQNILRETLRNTSFIFMEVLTLIAICLAAWIIGRSLIKTALKNMEIDESKHAFMSATAHELKTPIAIIQNQAEMILENVSPEKNQSYIESIYEESKRMGSIVRTMQQYDKMKSDSALTRSKFDLAEVVRNEASKYRSAIQDKGIQLDMGLLESCVIEGDPNLLALVIDNYLSNAWKYTEPGGTISIKLEEASQKAASQKAASQNAASFSVFNTCKPLSEKDLKNVWSAMYKGDSARTRAEEQDAESGGMGLAVCKRILELHGFSYGCTNKSNGVEFYFRTDNHV